MTEIVQTFSSVDAATSERWQAKSRAAAVKHWAFAGSAVALAVGLSAAAVIWAQGQKIAPDRLAEAVATALSRLGPLKVAGEVSMRDGTVRLEPPAPLKLDPTASVRVKGRIDAPVLPQIKPNADSDPIRRTVTVFTSVPWPAGGHITSGWEYPAGDAKVPSNQFCYWLRPAPTGNGDERDMLADNRIPRETARARFGAALNTMLAKCQWTN